MLISNKFSNQLKNQHENSKQIFIILIDRYNIVSMNKTTKFLKT